MCNDHVRPQEPSETWDIEQRTLTVVNQTHSLVKTNRRHIIEVETFNTKLNKEEQYIQSVMHINDQLISFSDTELRIDQSLSAIESVHSLWLRQVDLYYRPRASLEIGRLTEDILPPNDLHIIIENC